MTNIVANSRLANQQPGHFVLHAHRFAHQQVAVTQDAPQFADLAGRHVHWAQFRRAKRGVKAHVLLDHDDYLPAYVLLTEAKRSDVKMADSFPLNPTSIVVIDRSYNDYALFARWSAQEVWFVTRLKDNAAHEVVEECEIPQNRNILSDQLIRLTGTKARRDYPALLAG